MVDPTFPNPSNPTPIQFSRPVFCDGAHHPVPADHEPELAIPEIDTSVIEMHLREDIASLESDIRSLGEAAAGIREELPKMERDLLVFERDAALGRLKLHELRAELARLEGVSL